MSPLFIVLLVFFTVVMVVWLLILLGTMGPSTERAPVTSWLPWLACCLLGIVVFLLGSGALTIVRV